MSRAGKALERLVASIERALGKSDGLTVDSPKRLRDRVTGRLREHDVVITVQQGHHLTLTALECRDRSRPVGVPQVEEFHQKCRDTGIDKGIIVSNAGFRNTALKKAQHYGIRCFSLEETENFNWIEAGELRQFERRVHHQNCFLKVNEDLGPLEEIDVFLPSGEKAQEAWFLTTGIRALEAYIPTVNEPVERSKVLLKVRIPDLIARNRNNGRQSEVEFILLSLDFEVTLAASRPFTLHRYSEPSFGGTITELASVPINAGSVVGNLLVVTLPDGSRQVIIEYHRDQSSHT